MDRHEEEKVDDIKFGIRIIKYTRTPFERQILESVKIQQERQDHFLLNSRAEYNRCAIPRLSSKIGENEFKKWEEEGEREKEREEVLKEKILKLKFEKQRRDQEERKQANKERQPKTKQSANKRQKLEDGEYKEKRGEAGTNLREEKPKGEEKHQEKDKNRDRAETTRQREGETPKRQQDNTGEKRAKKSRRMTEMEEWLQEKNEKESRWIEFPDYQERAKEINQSILREERDRNSRIERARKEERTWDLMKLCIEYLEEKCTT